LLLVAGPSWAASRITTSDGNVIFGDIERLQDGVYSVRTPNGTVQIPASAVKEIQSNAAPCSGSNCSQDKPTSHQALRLAGSNTIGAKLAPELLKAYAQSLGATDVQWVQSPDPEEGSLKANEPNGSVFEAELAAHGSGTAAQAILDGKADIGMMSRRIKDDEAAKLAGAGFGDATASGQEHVLALDGILVLVHPSNSVTSLSLSQLQSIFSGERTNWSDFGGSAGTINIYARDNKSGTFDTFKNLVLKDRPVAPNAKRFESSTELSDAVSADPAGIGFVGIAYARNARPLSIALDCGLQYPPTEFLVKTEEYPLARRLFFYTAANPSNPEVSRFVEYALSSNGQPVVANAEFVSLQVEKSGPSYGASRVAAAASSDIRNPRLLNIYAKALNGAERLSVTYRFVYGKADLDNRAVRDIKRLVEFLNRPENANRKVMLLGFADSRGSARAIYRLSEERAQTVAQALRANGFNRQLLIGGFGAFAPVACDSTPEGADKNRRVEVWIE
jgi:phosphate transport system substrate-binding protein